MTQAGLEWRIYPFPVCRPIGEHGTVSQQHTWESREARRHPGGSWVVLETAPRNCKVMLSAHSFLMSADWLFHTVLFLINVAFG